MTSTLFLALTFLVAYLIGAVPFGYLVARSRGVDLLKVGSGNIGATNVGRVVGRGWGFLVFVLDFAKGALPVLAAMRLAGQVTDELPAEALGVAAGLATFLGHLFPIYLRFRGGKGVATGAGIVLVLAPNATLIALAVWALVIVSTRYVSLASLTAAVVLCAVHLSRGREAWTWPGWLVTAFCLTATMFVFLRHTANISRLLRGAENRLRDTEGLFLTGKVLHVLALGLWFGMTVFFTFIVGVSLFRTFERLSVEPRPVWLPLPGEFAGEPPSRRFPDPLRKEQGSRLAGAAVTPLFEWYFPLQLGCAIAAAVTALGWSLTGRDPSAGRVRATVLVVALATVAGGWGLEREILALRVNRNETTDAVLAAAQPSAALIVRADAARLRFGQWHFASLLLNFLTVLLVTMAMALTAVLPMRQVSGAEVSADATTLDQTERQPIA